MFDAIDGCFMNFAYDWAFAKPVRKVFYNLTITGLSVFVAFFIGTVEIVDLIGQEANLNDPFFNFFQNFNVNTAGFIIVGAFVATWAIALLYWRLARVEEKWDAKMLRSDVSEPALAS
jgi:nickel/cobalt transporter (NiCoT) family protein